MPIAIGIVGLTSHARTGFVLQAYSSVVLSDTCVGPIGIGISMRYEIYFRFGSRHIECMTSGFTNIFHSDIFKLLDLGIVENAFRNSILSQRHAEISVSSGMAAAILNL